MVAFGRILQSLTGIDPSTGILIAAAIVLLYTFAGGMWAVTLTVCPGNDPHSRPAYLLHTAE